VACIGPKTAETAIEFGLRVDVQPETAQVGPLVEALAEHAARLRAEADQRREDYQSERDAARAQLRRR